MLPEEASKGMEEARWEGEETRQNYIVAHEVPDSAWFPKELWSVDYTLEFVLPRKKGNWVLYSHIGLSLATQAGVGMELFQLVVYCSQFALALERPLFPILISATSHW